MSKAQDQMRAMLREVVLETLMATKLLELVEETADRVVEQVIEALVVDEGWLASNGKIRRVKCCEHEFDDEDSEGSFTVWTFSTHGEAE